MQPGKQAVGLPGQSQVVQGTDCNFDDDMSGKRKSVSSIDRGDAQDNILGPYEVYILSLELKTGVGIALIDTGAQISLVKEESIVKNIIKDNERMEIQGISGNKVMVKGKAILTLDNCKDPIISEFYVVDKLPRNILY